MPIQTSTDEKKSLWESPPLRRGKLVRDTVAGGRHLIVEEELGRGAFAVVYRVRDVKTGKLNALKCLSKYGLSWKQLTLQREEATLHKSLGNHPNIVHLERYFEDKDWLFLVLEYFPGRDLFYWIAERRDERAHDGNPRASTERQRVVRDIFAQVLEAVSYCHHRGVYHRDIKPENFIVCDDGSVKLTDFGLATTAREAHDLDCGSPPYMSPECHSASAVKKPYSPRSSDIWSLGVLLLILLYRRTPWDEANLNIPRSAFQQFYNHPLKYLSNVFGCDSHLAKFLVRRVFCPAEHGRISVAEWLRLWYEDEVLPPLSPCSRRMRSASCVQPIAIKPGRGTLKEPDELMSQSVPLHSSSPLPSVGHSPSVIPQLHLSYLRCQANWSDLEDEHEPDFSSAVVFEDQAAPTGENVLSPTARVDKTIVAYSHNAKWALQPVERRSPCAAYCVTTMRDEGLVFTLDDGMTV